MEFLSRHKTFFILGATILCIAISIITINLKSKPSFLENSLGFVIVPMQNISTDIANWVNDKIYFFNNLNAIEKENAELKAKLEEMEAEQSRLKLVELENKKLSDLLAIDQKYPAFPKIGAEIKAKDPGNWYNRFLINKGTNDGLDTNMVVLASGGLVGKILESGTTYSKIVALIDDTSSISAKSVRTDDLGFVKGDMELSEEGLCRMEHIDINAEIMAGDEIVTSQLSEIFPPGITIGYVKEINVETNGLTKYAVIQPVVDFKHMESVLVINKRFGNNE